MFTYIWLYIVGAVRTADSSDINNDLAARKWV
jgi:hypothetical protein